jgi:hypothetical protein
MPDTGENERPEARKKTPREIKQITEGRFEAERDYPLSRLGFVVGNHPHKSSGISTPMPK